MMEHAVQTQTCCHKAPVMVHSLMQILLILQQKQDYSLTSARRSAWKVKRNAEQGLCSRQEVNLKRIKQQRGAEWCGAGRSPPYKSFFFLDLFIHMEEQQRAGLYETIELSPQTLTWSAFASALIIFNYAHLSTSCNSYSPGLGLQLPFCSPAASFFFLFC